MSWLYLILAIFFEVAGTVSMKMSQGFTRLIPSISIFICYGITLIFITCAIRKIELSVAYTVWAGVGTSLIALVGIFYFGEQLNLLKVASILLVIIGVAGLKLSSS